ncbi:stage III sporulation protein SpoIIIAB [Longirhabdus pacifica]|uniref:stage III sporulation protein SpoIIIAB n=1 Tax=Longirhabdus pacifica TaxID=2305227 RepID=UPI0013E8A13B|nr:stage III sporulation protein SpoIIIAB [Longirhabdus pacifica]
MLQLFGSVFILFSSTMIGFSQAARIHARTSQLRLCIHAMQRLQTEVTYGLTPLPEALQHISKVIPSPPLANMFYDISMMLSEEGTSTQECWLYGISKHWRKTAMKKAEKEILERLGSTLGLSDQDNQLKHIQLAVQQLQMEEEHARANQMRLSKMWRSLGILTGLLVTIILL